MGQSVSTYNMLYKSISFGISRTFSHESSLCNTLSKLIGSRCTLAISYLAQMIRICPTEFRMSQVSDI